MPTAPVQQKILIEDIQEGIIVLKGGSELRAVLMTTATNFGLKSSQEQDAIIMKYQAFLNSLDFQIQIAVISRKLDISDYLDTLDQRKKEQTNELLKIQITEYVDFIRNLVQVSSIMNQTFFVIIPLARIEKKESGFIEKLGLFKNKNSASQETKSLDELKSQLWQRVEYVASGLAGIGLKSVPLNSQELTQLFYHLYNMGLEEKPAFVIEEEKKETA